MSILTSVTNNDLGELKRIVKKSKKDLRRYYRDHNGNKTAFQIAVSRDSYEVVEWLLANQKSIFKDDIDTFKAPFSNYPVTHLARSVKMLDLLYSYDYIVEEDFGRSFLKDLCDYNIPEQEEMFKWGLAHGANPLSGEDSQDFSVFGKICLNNKPNLLELLKPFKPNPDHKDSLGRHILNLVRDIATLTKIMEFSPTIPDRFIISLSEIDKGIFDGHQNLVDYIEKFEEFGKSEFLPKTVFHARDIFIF